MTSSNFSLQNLCTIQMESLYSFKDNLKTLSKELANTPRDSLVVAPEVCLSGFAYDRFEEAANFSKKALRELLSLTEHKILIYTQIEKIDGAYYNVANVLHNGKVLRRQLKSKLFTIGEELKHFMSGDEDKIVVFEAGGVKLGILICFEMRFSYLWERLRGADVIVVPSMWGRERDEHFVALSRALAIVNQAYVCASDSANIEATAQSGIISPFGKEQRNGNSLTLMVKYSEKEIKKMRRYIDVGISNR